MAAAFPAVSEFAQKSRTCRQCILLGIFYSDLAFCNFKNLREAVLSVFSAGS